MLLADCQPLMGPPLMHKLSWLYSLQLHRHWPSEAPLAHSPLCLYIHLLHQCRPHSQVLQGMQLLSTDCQCLLPNSMPLAPLPILTPILGLVSREAGMGTSLPCTLQSASMGSTQMQDSNLRQNGRQSCGCLSLLGHKAHQVSTLHEQLLVVQPVCMFDYFCFDFSCLPNGRCRQLFQLCWWVPDLSVPSMSALHDATTCI